MQILKRKYLEHRAVLDLGMMGELAKTPAGLWYFSLDQQTYRGPYKNRFRAMEAWTEAKGRQGALV